MVERITRWVFAHFPRFRPSPDIAEVKERVEDVLDQRVSVEGAPCVWIDVFRPHDRGGPLPLLVWAHGGGYFAGHRGLVDDLSRVIADHGFAVASVGYSLTREARYPAPVRQVDAAVSHLIAHAEYYGIDAERIALGGDSAGAQIASQLAALRVNGRLAEACGIYPTFPTDAMRAIVLLCGFFDLVHLPRTVRPFLRRIVNDYLGEPHSSDPRLGHMSAAIHCTARYPATFLAVGNGDPLQGQSHRLARALRARGVPVELMYAQRLVWPVPHEFVLYMDDPMSQECIRRTVAFLRWHLRDRPTGHPLSGR